MNIILCCPVLADKPDTQILNPEPFGLWLQQLEHDALAQGIHQQTLSDALSDIAPIPEVIGFDRRQPETTSTLQQYLSRVVTTKRVERGQQLLADNRELLEKIGKEYNVQPQFIVALWGVESSFGDRMGDYSIVESLATLAYDGRRSDFFRAELINALKIIDAGDVSAGSMTGSWAGAMGQCQFMPSSFLQFAVDYDHDGKRDIWDTPADIFASVANYLHSSGWHGEEDWGMEVQLPNNFSAEADDIKQTKPLSSWSKMGVRQVDGSALPASDTTASLIKVGDGEDAKSYIVFGNYKVLLKWNRSRYFATAVGMLADQIGN